MTGGFEVEQGRLGLMVGTMQDVADALGQAKQALSGLSGGDFGHPELNSAVSQLMEVAGSHLGMLGQHAECFGESLRGTQQLYDGSDDGSAAVFQQISQPESGVNPLLQGPLY